ncbi:MAG: ABC transporter ATP-binding protein [Chloroflexi bacterium]|nr:ABC transporter ATP-binding protein [Chloroflexota bacterium]
MATLRDAVTTLTPAGIAVPDHVVSIRGLRKSYGELEAVKGIDLDVRRGEVFALLGPNGAGKTTTLEILEGYRTRTAGEVSVLGHDPGRRDRQLQERIGICLQTTGIERYLSVVEIIELYRGYYPRPRPVDELLDLVGLTDQADVRVRRLSGGQRRRLDLAVALSGDPELLFLDEPTTGFDPGARRQAWEMVKRLTGSGRTVLLTTHFMDEAQVLADRLVVLVGGVIVAQGTPSEVVAGGSATTVIRVQLPPHLATVPETFADVTVSRTADTLELRTALPTLAVHALTSWAIEAGFEFQELSVSRPSLEDAYLELVGQDAHGAPDEHDVPPVTGRASRGHRR